jgi:hypothetical protein
MALTPEEKEAKKTEKTQKKVKSALLGAKVTIKGGEVFYVEDTAACVKKLEQNGITDYLE